MQTLRAEPRKQLTRSFSSPQGYLVFDDAFLTRSTFGAGGAEGRTHKEDIRQSGSPVVPRSLTAKRVGQHSHPQPELQEAALSRVRVPEATGEKG